MVRRSTQAGTIAATEALNTNDSAPRSDYEYARNVVTILVGIAAALWIASGVFEVLAIMADILAFVWLRLAA